MHDAKPGREKLLQKAELDGTGLSLTIGRKGERQTNPTDYRTLGGSWKDSLNSGCSKVTTVQTLIRGKEVR
jgi:hypothetical protein